MTAGAPVHGKRSTYVQGCRCDLCKAAHRDYRRAARAGATLAAAAPSATSSVTGRHVIADIRYRDERIECTCGAIVTARPDLLEHDRHRPLVAAWEEHRRAAAVVGASRPRTGEWSMA